MDEIRAIAERHGLRVIEDAAHAIGAEWRGRRIGAHGNVACFSFYATKNITTAEGGAVATPDGALADRIERLALHGLSSGAWRRYSDTGFHHYVATELGAKLNMTDLHASLGIHQLARLDAWIERRAELWERYDELLANLPLSLPAAPSANTRHARHLYSVRLHDDAPLSRDELLGALDAERIGAGVHFLAVHLHPYYRERYGYRTGLCPEAERYYAGCLSLPCFPDLSETDQETVIDAVKEALG
jgi:dTDP-4-amino-4,6-dideoxygalactose transaminase